jgi:hypothetical protein
MNCPFCTSNAHDGPFIRGGIQYDCGTFVWDDEIDRSNQSPKCINAEVGALKARIARLEEAGDECARYSTAQASDDWHAAKEAKP